MNKELTQQLFEKYPKIFVQKNLPPRESLMCFGCEHGDGWYWLLDQLCNSIQSYIDCNKHKEIVQVEAVQVKEKFGSLRFYYNGGNEYISGMVSLAEHMSYNICEKCGSMKNVKRTKGWIKALCEDCFPKEENKGK